MSSTFAEALGGAAAAARALHVAAFEGNVEVVRELLARGADPTIVEPRFNATARGWAEYAGQQEVVDLLDG